MGGPRRERNTRCTWTRRPAESDRERPGRFDPRAVALAAAIAFGLLVSSISWALLGAVAAWLAVAALVSRGDRTVVPLGAGLAMVLGTVVFSIAMLGGQGIEDSLARGTRAALLVLVATWLRAAAGTIGLREVSRRCSDACAACRRPPRRCS